MRNRSILLLLAMAALAFGAAPAAASTSYYVSLGDSLSVGVQPLRDATNTNTDEGYADQLFASLQRRRPSLEHVSLGCGYATSKSIMDGSRACAPARRTPYANKSPKTSQLAYAERFLRTHKGHVAYVTIDIGANDVASCAKDGKIDLTCVSNGIKAIQKNAPVIAKRLRAAAGSKVPMAAMTLYDPFLQQWLVSENGKGLAKASVDIDRNQVNKAIVDAFKRYRFRIADVATTFSTYVPFEQTTTLAPYGTVPKAVAQICRLTWMCQADKPNIHLNKAGYALAAKTFASALR